MTSLALPVVEPSQTAEARRRAAALAARLDFSESDAGRLAIVVTEAATNLVKHGGGGEVLFRVLPPAEGAGIEMLALDRGPGIRNAQDSLRDGYSTSGSPGTGLGAIARLCTRFDIYSVVGVGTAVLAQIVPKPPAPGQRSIEIGAVCVSKPGEEVSGDEWGAVTRPDGAVVVVADGLGHGVGAADASAAAMAAFRLEPEIPPGEVVARVHAALRSTRGAATAVAAIDLRLDVVKYAGLGNISGAIIAGGAARHLVSNVGTAGLEARKIGEFTYSWCRQAILVLHSDGLGTHWSLDRYPGLVRRHPSLIAGVLYRDFSRRRDDATVVVAREAEGGPRP